MAAPSSPPPRRPKLQPRRSQLRCNLRCFRVKAAACPRRRRGWIRVWFRRLHHPRRRFAPGLVPRRHFAPNPGTSPPPTFQRKRMPLVPARPLGPTDSGLVPDDVEPSVFADEAAKSDLDHSLKLLMRGRKRKGIRGGDAEPRFHSASLHGNLLVGRHSRHLFGHPFRLSLRSVDGVPSPSSLRSLGPYCVTSLLALRRHIGGVCGCLPSMPLRRFAPPWTPSADHALPVAEPGCGDAADVAKGSADGWQPPRRCASSGGGCEPWRQEVGDADPGVGSMSLTGP